MVVSELTEWLKTQDQGATVEVLKVEKSRGYTPEITSVVDFDPTEHVVYTDLRGNPFAKGEPYENQRTLLLGEK